MLTKGREALDTISEYLKQKFKGMEGPYFHVSDHIGNQKELDAIFSPEEEYHGYIRLGGHPDHMRLEKQIGIIEGGGPIRVRSDGMGAVFTAIVGPAMRMMETRSLKKVRIIVVLPVYGGTYDLAKRLTRMKLYNIEFVFVYANDPHLINSILKNINGNTVAIFCEISGNPTLSFPNVKGIVELARMTSAKPLVIVDDTFLFGLVKPFEWGVDIVVNSGTKMLVGLSAWSLGFVGISPERHKKDPELWQEMLALSWIQGGTLGPFEAWVTSQFSTTDLMDRMKLSSEYALEIARWLETHPKIERVIHPMLDSYPYKDNFMRHVRPIDGVYYGGGMIFAYLKTDSPEKTNEFLFYMNNHTHIANKASLYGDMDSIESARFLSHKGYTEKEAEDVEITPNSVRFSNGVLCAPDITMEAWDRSLMIL